MDTPLSHSFESVSICPQAARRAHSIGFLLSSEADAAKEVVVTEAEAKIAKEAAKAKEKEEKEEAEKAEKAKLPGTPGIVLQPKRCTGGKLKTMTISLDGLLDYHEVRAQRCNSCESDGQGFRIGDGSRGVSRRASPAAACVTGTATPLVCV